MQRVALLVSLVVVGCIGDDDPGPEIPGPIKETEITLNVLPAGSGFDPQRVVFVAYQEGDGAWKPMPGAGGVHKALIISDRYGVAVGCKARDLFMGETVTEILLHQTTVGETKVLTEAGCYLGVPASPPPATRMVNVSPSGLAANERGQLELRDFGFFPVLNNDPADISVEARPSPVFATVRAQGGPSNTLLRVRRLADVDFATATSVAVDFGQAVPPVSWPLTLPAGAPAVSVSTSVRRGEDFIVARMAGTSTTIDTVPASELREGDAVRITVSANDEGMKERLSYLYMYPPGPATMALPTHWSLPAPTVLSTGKRLLSLELPDGTSTFPIVDLRISASTAVGGLHVSHQATISSAWRGAGAKTYVFPDLSAIPGYSASMDLQTGAEVTWSMSRDELNTRAFVAGRILHSTIQGGVIAN